MGGSESGHHTQRSPLVAYSPDGFGIHWGTARQGWMSPQPWRRNLSLLTTIVELPFNHPRALDPAAAARPPTFPQFWHRQGAVHGAADHSSARDRLHAHLAAHDLHIHRPGILHAAIVSGYGVRGRATK